jgi:hypothetical protein
MGARPAAAHTQREHGVMLMRRDEAGDPVRARELLTSAARAYRDLGMDYWTERAERDLAGI